MPYDVASHLWPRANESFFRDRTFRVTRQRGPHCVSTVLGILTGALPEEFQGRINTQDPVSWSEALRQWDMKLAYCPTDVRKIKHYMRELVALDDLFTLSYYSTTNHNDILSEPDSRGWVTDSHIVILHRSRILDSKSGTETEIFDHECNDRHAKRIFRVVPASHLRGL